MFHLEKRGRQSRGILNVQVYLSAVHQHGRIFEAISKTPCLAYHGQISYNLPAKEFVVA
jgi:hypothetical protein